MAGLQVGDLEVVVAGVSEEDGYVSRAVIYVNVVALGGRVK